MSKQVIRKGDPNSMQGKVMKACESVLINGKPCARKTDPVKTHGAGKQKHPTNPIVKGDETFLVGGKPVAYLNVQDRCKHKMIKGSTDVLTKG